MKRTAKYAARAKRSHRRYAAMVKTKRSVEPIVMDTVTFQRLRRVLMDAARRCEGRQLPRHQYEDLQKVIVWADNIANSRRQERFNSW